MKLLLIALLSLNMYADINRPYILAYNQNSEEQSKYVKKALEYTKKLYRLAGINFKVITLPPKRSLHYLKLGQIDVDLIRVNVVAEKLMKAHKEYGVFKYPFQDEISIVSTNPDIERFNTIKDFKDSNKKIIALRGTELVELFIKKENIIYITKQSQGPEMLTRNRNQYLLTGKSTRPIVEKVFSKLGKKVYWGPKNKTVVQLVQVHGERAKKEILPKLNEVMRNLRNKENKKTTNPSSLNSIKVSTNW